MADGPELSAVSVGVAVPVFNAERFIGHALRSVLAQSYAVGDVVVVDDGSEDASAQVALDVGPPVRVVRRPHAGIGAARSHAMSLVRGEFIVPLDADDLLTPQSIGSRVEVLLASPDIDIVYGHVRHFAECLDGLPLALDLTKPAHVPDGMLIRRTAYERVGAFSPALRVAEALDWVLRAKETGLGEETVPEHVLWRRVHRTNNSLTERRSLNEFPRVLKASLDRRRAEER
jgi:glycosyltransferase involved in cell wall biosynthesis